MKKLLTAGSGKLIAGFCLILTAATTQAQVIASGTIQQTGPKGANQQTTSPGTGQQTITSATGQNEGAIIKYFGTQDDMVVFNVSYANPEGSRFQVIIKDQDGTQLYQNIFIDKTFYKQFRLPRADKDKIVFVIHNGKETDVVKTFEINVNSRFVQEVAVKKL
jgi:hypothetical protein